MDTTWKTLQKSSPYLIKFSQICEDLFHIDLTDYKKCWTSDLCRKSLLKYLKESNEGLEFDDNNELLNRGIDMLGNPKTLKKVIILHDKDETVRISLTKQYEVSLKLELCLSNSSSEHFFHVVVQPLLTTICDLRSSEHELRQALLKKDKEIEEYKIEGRAPRRLITTIYNDEKHMEKHFVFEKCFGSNDEETTTILKAVAQTNTVDIKNTSNSTPSSNPTSRATGQPIVKPSVVLSVNQIKIEPEEVKKITVLQPPDITDNTSMITTQTETVTTETIPTKNEESVKKECLLFPSPRKRQRKKLNL